IAAKTFLPEAVTQHRDLIEAGAFVLELKSTAELRLYSQSTEVIAGHSGYGQTLRLTLTSQVQGQRHREGRGELFESGVLLAKVEKVERRDAGAIAAVANVPPHPDESIRFGKRQRAQEHCVDQTKDRSVRADSQRQGD